MAAHLLEKGDELVNEGVHCGSGLDEDHHPPGPLQLPHHLLQRVGTDHICTLCLKQSNVTFFADLAS